MANRNWLSGGKIFSMHKDPTIVTCAVTIGATGAVSSYVGSVTASVVRTSTGIYTITMQAQTGFPSMYFASGSMRSPVSGLSGISSVEIGNAPNTTGSSSNNFAAVIVVKTLSPSGALADPASGSVLNAFMFFANSIGTAPATGA